MTVLDPRHPLFGRSFRLAERRPGPTRQKERIFVFFGSGPLLRLPPWALEAPRLEEPRTVLCRAAVEDLVAAARALCLFGDPSPDPSDSSPHLDGKS